MKRRGFFGALAGLLAASRVKVGAKAPPAARRVGRGKTPGPAWDTMTRMHAFMGGDEFVRYYVAPDEFCDQLEREMAPMAPIAGPSIGWRTLLGWRRVRIYRPDEAAALGCLPPHFRDDSLYGYAPGAPGILGPGWGEQMLDYRRNPGVNL